MDLMPLFSCVLSQSCCTGFRTADPRGIRSVDVPLLPSRAGPNSKYFLAVFAPALSEFYIVVVIFFMVTFEILIFGELPRFSTEMKHESVLGPKSFVA